MAFESMEDLFKAADDCKRLIFKVKTRIGEMHIRTLSATEYQHFLDDGNKNSTLVCLALCNEDGDGIACWSGNGKVGVKDEYRTRLESADFPGDVLNALVQACLKNCFPDPEVVAKNSESVQSDA